MRKKAPRHTTHLFPLPSHCFVGASETWEMYARDTLLHCDSVSTLGKRRRARAYRYEKRDGKETTHIEVTRKRRRTFAVRWEKAKEPKMLGWLAWLFLLAGSFSPSRFCPLVRSRRFARGFYRVPPACLGKRLHDKDGKKAIERGGETTAQRANIGSPREGRS